MEKEISITGKHCPSCGRYLPVSAFASNKSRKDGLQVHCKDCHNAARRAKQKKRRHIKKLTDPGTIRGTYDPATGERVYMWMTDIELPKYLYSLAEKVTYDEDFQQDMVINAWIEISKCPGSSSIEYLKSVGAEVIKRKERSMKRKPTQNDYSLPPLYSRGGGNKIIYKNEKEAKMENVHYLLDEIAKIEGLDAGEVLEGLLKSYIVDMRDTHASIAISVFDNLNIIIKGPKEFTLECLHEMDYKIDTPENVKKSLYAYTSKTIEEVRNHIEQAEKYKKLAA